MNHHPFAVRRQLGDQSLLSDKCGSQLRLGLKTNLLVGTVVLRRKRETNCPAASKKSSCLRIRVLPFQCVSRFSDPATGTVSTNEAHVGRHECKQ